jgi:transposase
MHIERKAGEKMEVDWAGDRPELVVDRETGELRKVHLFVAIVGVSKLVYGEAFPDEKLPNWTLANTHALEYYGATPRIVVPDNTKTAVIRQTKYDPIINSTYLDWAEHYGVAVIPALNSKNAQLTSIIMWNLNTFTIASPISIAKNR